ANLQSVEGIQRGDGAGRRHLEGGRRGRAVEVAVTGLDEARVHIAASTSGAVNKGMQHGEVTIRGDLEDRAESGSGAVSSRAVEGAIAALDEAGKGLAAIGAVEEGMELGELAVRRDP